MRHADAQSDSLTSERHWLIWDGECGFCRQCIEWVQQHDVQKKFNPVAFQDAPSPPMTPELREQSRRAVQVVTAENEILSAGMACAFVLEAIGYRKLGRAMRLRVLRPLVEWGYRRVANNRRFFGCVIFGNKRKS